MNNWNLELQQIQSLTLAADIRLGKSGEIYDVDYPNDHIWELKTADGSLDGLILSTTYGLRARRFIMFPQFCLDGICVSQPSEFYSYPTIQWAFPNYAQISFSPFLFIDVEADFWVPESHVVCGRLRIINRDQIPHLIRLDWIALLTPLEGHCMGAAQIQRAWALTGKTGSLAPVVCMMGSAEVKNTPYPALSLSTEVLPNTWRDWVWSQAALSSESESYRLARSYFIRNWEAERTRIQMINVSQIEVHSALPEWDTAFTLSQQIALGLFTHFHQKENIIIENPLSFLPYPSFVQSRLPSQGYSLRGDGSDYGHQWNGQTPLHSYYLSSIILPIAPELVKGIVRNFLAIQDKENGFIDHRPGLSRQRSHLLACPILASLVWKIYLFTGQIEFLSECYDPLIHFVELWFSEYDQDQDGIPEWKSSIQFDFEDHPIFSRQDITSQGATIGFVESPTLGAFLFSECQALYQMAQILGRDDQFLHLTNHKQISLIETIKSLQIITEETWFQDSSTYHYRDRDTHTSSQGMMLSQCYGSGTILIEQDTSLSSKSNNPMRLILRMDAGGERTQRPQVTIFGCDIHGKPVQETLSTYEWQWHLLKIGRVTSQKVYQRIDKIIVDNINDDDKITVTSLDYYFEDISLLLPLWSHLPKPEQAALLITNSLLNVDKYWCTYGLSSFPLQYQYFFDTTSRTSDPSHQGLSLLWNQFICEGLLAYGYRQEAAMLFSNLMNGITSTMKTQKSLFEKYEAKSGHGFGERNTLSGLAPLGLYLNILGVTLFSPWKVGLSGKNPFAWDVRIDYCGLSILRQADKTILTFPDEQVIEVSDESPCIVSLED